jgi:hypothetical protein
MLVELSLPIGSRSVFGRCKIELFYGPINGIHLGTTFGFSRAFNSQPPIERAAAIFAVSGLAFRWQCISWRIRIPAGSLLGSAYRD